MTDRSRGGLIKPGTPYFLPVSDKPELIVSGKGVIIVNEPLPNRKDVTIIIVNLNASDDLKAAIRRSLLDKRE